MSVETLREKKGKRKKGERERKKCLSCSRSCDVPVLCRVVVRGAGVVCIMHYALWQVVCIMHHALCVVTVTGGAIAWGPSSVVADWTVGPEKVRRGEDVEGVQGEDDGRGVEDVEEDLCPDDVAVPSAEELDGAVTRPV